MMDTISLFKDALKHNAMHYNSLYLFSKLRVVVCQDTSKMQEGVKKTLDFLVCFCNIITLHQKKQSITLGNSAKWCYSYTLCDKGHTPIYYQCNTLMIVICGSSQLGSFTKIIFLVVTLHVINIPE